MATPRRTVLVTVGTTQFDGLVLAVCRPEFAAELKSMGFDSMRVQIGRGTRPPQDWGEENQPGAQDSWFRFTQDLPAEMKAVTKAAHDSLTNGTHLR